MTLEPDTDTAFIVFKDESAMTLKAEEGGASSKSGML